MTFKPDFLTEIGIVASSVPEGLTATFPTIEQSQLIITNGNQSVTVPTKAYFGETSSDVKENLANTLVKLGARKAPEATIL